MKTFFLDVGLVIQRADQRLEYVGRTHDELYFEEPESGRRHTILEKDFWIEFQYGRLVTVDAISTKKELTIQNGVEGKAFHSLADASNRYQKETKRRLAYVKGIKAEGIGRGQKRAIKRVLKSLAVKLEDTDPPSVETVCRWIRAWESSDGDISSLINGNARRRKPVHVNDESEAFIQHQIEKHYLVSTRPSITTAYTRYKYELAQLNEEKKKNGLAELRQIAARTFHKRIAELPRFEVMEARYGREKARHHFKMTTGHMPAQHPLDVVEIDHSPMNLYVIDDKAYLPLGRPWLTVIIDRYSGIILGIYISFQSTGLRAIFGALKHSLMPNKLVRETWPDIKNPWPAYGRGCLYVSDRGADFTSLAYRTAITSLGSMYELCERRTPWLKGSVERFFKTLESGFFETMPGKTFANISLRGEYKPEKQAVIRFSTLVYLLHLWVVDIHNVHVHSRKLATPLELWTEGVGVAPPPYPAHVEELDIVLGTRYTSDLSHEGIRFNYLRYASPELNDVMKVYGRDSKIDYVVSDENIASIMVKHPVDGSYFAVPCTRPDYASGLSLFQHKHLVREARQSLAQRQALHVDHLVSAQQKFSEAIQLEIHKFSNKSKTRLSRLAEINSNATLVGNDRSVASPFVKVEAENSTVITTARVLPTNVAHLWSA